MATTEGFTHYACDVASCATDAYAIPGSDGADQFSVRRRIDAQGVERTMLVCADHAKAYQAIAEGVDAVWAQFAKDGTGAIVSQADLDAANKRADERDKAAKWWSDKYSALKAEYDAYRAAHPDTADGGAE